MDLTGVFMSESDEWATPKSLYDELNKEFRFNLDPCATDENHKCDDYFTAEDDGLTKDWGGTESSAIPLTAKLISG